MTNLHKSYLLADAERICARIKLKYTQINRDLFIVDGIEFNNYKTMLEYVYNKEARGCPQL